MPSTPYYNETPYEDTPYFWDLMTANNIVSGELFFLLFLLVAPFFLVLMIVKGAGGQNNIAFLSASVSLSFISIIMYALEAVGQHIPIICGVILLGSIIMYKLSE